ncbi:hypothetical protein F4778DRAFT_798307 [Xylariomycetidae sp. FL2044]|nr:hypothetical protein F4778DRAFT_798307 [Xylariomycetidae sp. FL2044]
MGNPKAESSGTQKNKKSAARKKDEVGDQEKKHGWQTASKPDVAQRVGLQEDAMALGFQHADAIAKIISNAIEGIMDDSQEAENFPDYHTFKDWLKDYDDLKKKHQNFSVPVGLVGATGVGKTFLINTLLDRANFLPSSWADAATAVVSLLHYNHDNTPGREFIAEISFMTRETLEKELGQFFADLARKKDLKAEDYDGDIDDENFDSALEELEESLEEWQQKIKAIWGLEEEELYTMTPESLLASSEYVAKILEGTKIVESSDSDDFSLQIKSYMDSMTNTDETSGRKCATWPLIESVNVYVKSEILQNGVTLVDMPGLGDSSDVRSGVSAKIRKKLESTIVVTPAVRALDEKTAFSLMNDSHEIQMRMNGKMTKQSFCIVTTKIDETALDTSETQRARSKNNAELEKDIEAVTQLQYRKKKINEAYESSEKTLEDKRSKLSTMREMADKAPDLQPTVDDAEKELIGCEKARDQYAQKLKKLNDSITFYEGRRAFLYCREQSRHIRQRARVHFKKRQDRHRQRVGRAVVDGDADTKVHVFPTCAPAYWKIKKEEGVVPGFPSVEYTGVPSFRKWIRHATLSKRDEHASQILASLVHLFNQMKIWSDEKWSTEKAKCTRDELEKQLEDGPYARLNSELKTYWNKLAKQVQNVDPLDREEEILQECNKKGKIAVENWNLREPHNKKAKMHWLTFDRIVEGRGRPYSSRGKYKHDYQWMKDLSNLILEQIAEQWDQEIHQKLPDIKVPKNKNITDLWRLLIKRMATHLETSIPGMKLQLIKNQNVLQDIEEQVTNKAKQVLCDISAECDQAHEGITENIENEFEEGFEDALHFIGKGHFRKRHQTLKKHFTKKDSDIFVSAIVDMRKQLDVHKSTARHRLHEVTIFALKQVKDIMDLIFNNISKTAWEEAPDSYDTEGAARKAEVRQGVEQWSEAWKITEARGPIDSFGEEDCIPTTYIPVRDDLDVRVKLEEED